MVYDCKTNFVSGNRNQNTFIHVLKLIAIEFIFIVEWGVLRRDHLDYNTVYIGFVGIATYVQ